MKNERLQRDFSYSKLDRSYAFEMSNFTGGENDS